jgi:hypothetical protein
MCKEVGHLKNTCLGKIRKQSTWKVDWSESATDVGFSGGKGANSLEEDSIINSINWTSFIGKLKFVTHPLRQLRFSFFFVFSSRDKIHEFLWGLAQTIPSLILLHVTTFVNMVDLINDPD